MLGSSDIKQALAALGLDKPSVKANKLAQLDIIRSVPVAITQKRNIRDDAFNSARGFKGYGFLQWKARQQQAWAKMKASTRDTGEKLELWRTQIKEIDGHFGPGVVSFFIFLKTLFKMNIFISFIWLVFVVIPGAVLSSSASSTTSYVNASVNSKACSSYNCDYVNSSVLALTSTCSIHYYNYTINSTAKADSLHKEVLNYTEDFIDGSGWMEFTPVFQGYYSSSTLALSFLADISSSLSGYSYNLPLAYILITGVYMLSSLFILAIGSASTIKENMVKNAGKRDKYCDLAFSSWSFSLVNESSAVLAKKQIKRAAKALIAEKRDAERRRNLTQGQRGRVYFLRIIVNLLVLALLGCAGYLIVYVTQKSAELKSLYSGFVKILISYAPSLTLTVLNMLLPNLFSSLSRFEDLKPATRLTMALIRSVVVRLAGLAVLVFTLYTQVTCAGDSSAESVDECNVHGAGSDTCPQLYCWETYVGQQFYKLVLMQLFVTLGVTLFVDFPRRLIATKCGCKLAKLIGLPEFNISANVLELVYLQAICWFGAFFTPLLPSMTFILLLIMFYLKRVSLLMNYKPNEESYRASDANTFFVVLLLLSLVVTLLPLSYIVVKLGPSRGCGPFRIYDVMYDLVHTTMCSWSCTVRDVFSFVTSANFVVPLLFALGVAIYYLTQVSSVHKQRADQLYAQLNMESEAKKQLTRQALAQKFTKLPEGNKEVAGYAHTNIVPDSDISLIEQS